MRTNSRPKVQSIATADPLNQGLPGDLTAERAILGCLLMDDTRFPEIAVLEAADFTQESHRRIFRCMRELREASEPLDYVTVAKELKARGELESCGGVSCLTSLTEAVPVPHKEALAAWVRIVRDASTRRRLAEVGRRMTNEALSAEPLSDVLARVAVEIERLSASGRSVETFDVEGLLARDVQPAKMLIEAILPGPGAVLLVGTHKSGKTVLAVQMSIAIASGHAFLDNYAIQEPGPVLVLEQDDTNGMASLKDYLLASAVPTAGLPFTLVPRVPFEFGPEFVAWLESEIKARGLRFVVLDSYTALRPSRRHGGDIVKVEQAELAMLDALGKRNNSTILVLTHDSKGSFGMDWSDRAAGTFAMGAAVEGQIHISRFRDLPDSAPDRLVRARGRHFEGVEAVLRFRPTTLDYQLIIEGSAASFYPDLAQISKQFGSGTFSPKDLYQDCGMARASAHRLITGLLTAGTLHRHGRGGYQIAQHVSKALNGATARER
jgi:hypothetical protein